MVSLRGKQAVYAISIRKHNSTVISLYNPEDTVLAADQLCCLLRSKNRTRKDMPRSSAPRGRGGGRRGADSAQLAPLPRIGDATTTEQPSSSSVASGHVSSSSVPRGITRGIPLPATSGQRITAHVRNNYFVEDCVRTKIGPIIKAHLPQPYATWGMWTESDKELVWGKFLDYFTFESDSERELGRQAWEWHCAENYKKWMLNARRWVLARAGTTDISMTRDHNPEYFSRTMWGELVSHWSTPDWAKLSERGTEMTQSEKKMKHSAGSRPFAVHELRLTEEDPDRRPPTKLHHFQRTHQNSDGKWVSESAEQFASSFRERVQANSQPDGGQTVDDMSLWSDATGGPRKDRILGHPRQSARALLANRPSSSGETSCTGPRADATTMAGKLAECFNTMFDARIRMLLGDGYVIIKDPKLHGNTDDLSAGDPRGDEDVVGSNLPSSSRNEEDDDGAGCSDPE